MKSSDLRNLVQEYKLLRAKQAKSYDHKIEQKLGELEHRYYHETGTDLKTILTN